MIPYDDLVAALSSWRARKGLPVANQPAAPSGSPGSGPNRQAAPVAALAATPSRGHAAPVAHTGTSDDPLDVEDAAVLEDGAYEGDDYGADGEPTAIGSMPRSDTEDAPATPRGRGGNHDW